jgi:hypothetical protein
MRMRSVSRRASCPARSGSFASSIFLRSSIASLAQLRLNRAQLLPEIELALVLLDLDLRLALHVLHDPGARNFALEPAEDETQPLPDVEALEHLVLVGDPEVHVRRGQVGKTARVGDVHLQDRRHFIGNAIHHLGQRLGCRRDARDQVGDFVGIRGHVLRGMHGRDGEGLILLDVVDDDPAQPLQRDLHRVAGEIDALVHTRGYTHTAHETRRVDRLIVVAARDDESHDQTGFFVRAEKGEVLRGSHLYCDRTQRVDDRGSQCHERECGRELRLEKLFLALGSGHGP